jgi:predicted AAA+ superfamily ATPase
VGKTTIINQFEKTANLPVHYASADAVTATRGIWVSQQWDIARIQLNNSGGKESILIIDEVQKIENWSETVKKEWDRDSKNGVELKVVLLGSSRLLIQKGLTESLAGRFESIYVGHWSFREIHKAFGLDAEQYAWFGSYPGAIPLMEDENRWRTYIHESLIEPSISKDILQLTRIDKPVLMKRLFELGCNYSGQILSYNKIMGQLTEAGNTTTLAHYLHLLDTSGLLKGLEKYSPGMIRQRSSSPRFQVHNNALMSAQSGKTFAELKNQPEHWGRLVESLIGTHLLNQSLQSGFKLYYWRHNNDEIDFVIESGGKTIGIEVKSGHSSKADGLPAFSKKFNPFKSLLVGDTGIPWQEFLNLDPGELFR